MSGEFESEVRAFAWYGLDRLPDVSYLGMTVICGNQPSRVGGGRGGSR